MNQFKFRAWYKPHLDKGITEQFEQVEIDCELFFVSSKDKEVKYKFCIPFIDDDWIVEESIGASDVNGTDIFRGDILFDDFNNEIGYVVWNENNMRYEVCFYDSEGSDSYEPLDKNYANSLKIVGNIHDKEKENDKRKVKTAY